MSGKKQTETQQCRHDRMVAEADDFLAEIDKALGDNIYDDPGLPRGPGSEHLGTTQSP